MASEPQRSREEAIGASLGAATEQLRAALEREAAEVINRARAEAASVEEAARHRAEEVEEQARDRAARIQQDADARAQEVGAQAEAARAGAEEARSAQSDRATRLLEGVEALEARMHSMFEDLRAQLNGAIDAPPPPAEPAQPVAESAPAQIPGSEDRADGGAPAGVRAPEPDQAGLGKGVAFPKPIPMSLATEVDAATNPSPELDEMMRAQIVTLAETGKTRAEAERFLARFKFGESYIDLVDEIYSGREHGRQPGRTKRRRFARRR